MKKNWQTKTLGEVCEVIGGGTPSKANESFYRGSIPWATVRDMQGEFVDDTEFKITKEAVRSSSTNIIPAGNVIIASRVGLGKVSIINQDTAINQDLRAIIPKNPNQVFVRYLYRWLTSVAELIVENGSGATVQGVKLPFIKGLELPLPSIDEQHRIVQILDGVFAEIAKAKANLEKNLASARELFESYLQSVFANPGEDWEETNLGAQTELLCGFAFKSKQYTEKPSDIKLLRGDNIIPGSLRWEDVKRWPKSDAKTYSLYDLRSNDVVIAMDRTWIKAGVKFASITEVDLPCLLLQRVARLRVKPGLHSRFLHYLIGSKHFADHVLSLQTGTGVPHISGQQIKDFAFYKPSPKEQQEIILTLDSLTSETTRLESHYRSQLSSLDELKKSVLRQAFSGEL